MMGFSADGIYLMGIFPDGLFSVHPVLHWRNLELENLVPSHRNQKVRLSTHNCAHFASVEIRGVMGSQ